MSGLVCVNSAGEIACVPPPGRRVLRGQKISSTQEILSFCEDCGLVGNRTDRTQYRFYALRSGRGRRYMIATCPPSVSQLGVSKLYAYAKSIYMLTG